ncbi:MAG TPA: hypothetical protein VGJ46_02760 [Candidatus Limnocylindrales bacterium]
MGNYGSDTVLGGPGDDIINGDNPFPTGPIPPELIGGNDDNCIGGPGTDTIGHCETVS